MAQAPHPVFPIDTNERYGQQEHPLQPLFRIHLIERLRTLHGRRLDAGDLESAEILNLALSELEVSEEIISDKDLVICRQLEKVDYFCQKLKEYMVADKLATAPRLPGELPRQAPHLTMRDNPPPDTRSPLELVVSEATAMRALVRHYNWVYDGPDRLLRCRPLLPTAPAPLVDELVEAPGTIADLAAAAAQEVS
jgi:hypothetical protein